MGATLLAFSLVFQRPHTAPNCCPTTKDAAHCCSIAGKRPRGRTSCGRPLLPTRRLFFSRSFPLFQLAWAPNSNWRKLSPGPARRLCASCRRLPLQMSSGRPTWPAEDWQKTPRRPADHWLEWAATHSVLGRVGATIGRHYSSSLPNRWPPLELRFGSAKLGPLERPPRDSLAPVLFFRAPSAIPSGQCCRLCAGDCLRQSVPRRLSAASKPQVCRRADVQQALILRLLVSPALNWAPISPLCPPGKGAKMLAKVPPSAEVQFSAGFLAKFGQNSPKRLAPLLQIELKRAKKEPKQRKTDEKRIKRRATSTKWSRKHPKTRLWPKRERASLSNSWSNSGKQIALSSGLVVTTVRGHFASHFSPLIALGRSHFTPNQRLCCSIRSIKWAPGSSGPQTVCGAREGDKELQKLGKELAKNGGNYTKVSSNFAKFCKNSAKLYKILQNCAKFCKNSAETERKIETS